MGLDMHLTGEKYLFTDWENPANNQYQDGFRVKGLNLELGYWRKHPDLHGYIVENFGGGHDDCQPIRLSCENIQSIIEAVLENRLPKTSGFFFGESLNDKEQVDETVAILQEAMNWAGSEPEGFFHEVIYQASW
jgi:hypothetical protein